MGKQGQNTCLTHMHKVSLPALIKTYPPSVNPELWKPSDAWANSSGDREARVFSVDSTLTWKLQRYLCAIPGGMLTSCNVTFVLESHGFFSFPKYAVLGRKEPWSGPGFSLGSLLLPAQGTRLQSQM